MRLVSQDGMIDVPYENVIIACEKNRDDKFSIYARCSHCICLATYSTEDKALKVMEMLREQYMKLGMIKIIASGTSLCFVDVEWIRPLYNIRTWHTVVWKIYG